MAGAGFNYGSSETAAVTEVLNLLFAGNLDGSMFIGEALT